MEDGINKFIGRMTHMHEVTLAGNTLLHTGKLEPIDMRVTVRSGGKKVKATNLRCGETCKLFALLTALHEL